MTAQDHRKTIGILFLIFGGCTALLLIPVMLQAVAALNAAERASVDASPDVVQNSQNAIALVFVLIIVLGIFTLAASVIEITAGWGILKQKSWSPAAMVLAGIVSLVNFPIGTALGIYALWFWFSKTGKQFYQSQTAASPLNSKR